MFSLLNHIQPYAWGDTTAIPHILGLEPDGRPAAELWLGAHPVAPSGVRNADGRVQDGDAGTARLPEDPAVASGPEETDLASWISAHPEIALDPDARREFGDRLPYLMKILAARTALSIQAHPTLAQAREGYAREDAAGIPATDPHRNYKDPWHKPEMLCALGDFHALCGFRPVDAVRAMVLDLAGLVGPDSTEHALLEAWSDALAEPAEDFSAAFDLLMGEREAYGRLAGVLAHAREAVSGDAGVVGERGRLGSAVDPYETLCELVEQYPGDAGALVALMLNRVRLSEGQTLRLGAGILHAYLSGTGIEVMASSDNVLRAGLTPKHIDVAELARVGEFAPGEPEVLEVVEAGRIPGGVPDYDLFRLDSRADPSRGDTGGSAITGTVAGSGAGSELAAEWTAVDLRGPLIVLCVEGTFEARTGSGTRTLYGGDSVFVPVVEGAVDVRGTGLLVAAGVGGRD